MFLKDVCHQGNTILNNSKVLQEFYENDNSKNLLPLSNVVRDSKQQGLSFVAGENAKWQTFLKGSFSISHKTKYCISQQSSKCAALSFIYLTDLKMYICKETCTWMSTPVSNNWK